jgi:hypothetical protein
MLAGWASQSETAPPHLLRPCLRAAAAPPPAASAPPSASGARATGGGECGAVGGGGAGGGEGEREFGRLFPELAGPGPDAEIVLHTFRRPGP